MARPRLGGRPTKESTCRGSVGSWVSWSFNSCVPNGCTKTLGRHLCRFLRQPPARAVSQSWAVSLAKYGVDFV
eukprot:5458264-Prymnesium_polylepis.3